MHDTTTPFLRPISLWLSMVGAPIVWTIHLLTVWSITEFGCLLEVGINANNIRILVFLASLIAIAAAVYAGILAYRNWRQLENIDPEERSRFSRGIARGQFMTLTGMAFSALFTLVMLYMTVPMLILTPCEL